MSDRLIEYLWLRLQVMFEPLSDLITSLDNGIWYTVEKYANDAFPMRAYLAFTRSGHGDEIAITVDVQYRNEQWMITSDICMDEGAVLAHGPSIALKELSEESLAEWLGEFERFLGDNHELLKSQISKLE